MALEAATRIRISDVITRLEKKLDELNRAVSLMKHQADNPSVTRSYYTTLGKAEAVDTILQFIKTGHQADLNLL